MQDVILHVKVVVAGDLAQAGCRTDDGNRNAHIGEHKVRALQLILEEAPSISNDF